MGRNVVEKWTSMLARKDAVIIELTEALLQDGPAGAPTAAAAKSQYTKRAQLIERARSEVRFARKQ